MINPLFEAWALNNSGMIGNPGGKYWFSGIEYGRQDNDKNAVNRGSELMNQIEEELEIFNSKQYLSWDEAFKAKHKNEYTAWRTYKKISKFIVNYANQGWAADKYLEKEMFVPGGDSFLVNLFPLDFPKTTTPFNKAEKQLSGLADKKEYYNWCKVNRFGVLRRLFDKNRAHIDFVLCFGKSHVDEFISVYAQGQKAVKREIRINRHHGQGRAMIYLSDTKPRLFIVPHFACRWWSDDDLKWLGDKIKSIT